MRGPASPPWDALEASTVALTTGGPRRGIIVLTDGRGSANRTAFGDVLTKLENARRLAYLADVTGGSYRAVKRKDVEAAVKQAAGALRSGLPR